MLSIVAMQIAIMSGSIAVGGAVVGTYDAGKYVYHHWIAPNKVGITEQQTAQQPATTRASNGMMVTLEHDTVIVRP